MRKFELEELHELRAYFLFVRADMVRYERAESRLMIQGKDS